MSIANPGIDPLIVGDRYIFVTFTPDATTEDVHPVGQVFGAVHMCSDEHEQRIVAKYMCLVFVTPVGFDIDSGSYDPDWCDQPASDLTPLAATPSPSTSSTAIDAPTA